MKAGFTIGRTLGLAALAVAIAAGVPDQGAAQMPPNKTEIRAFTGLFASVVRGSVEETKQLLARKANPNATDDKGRTPLHIAAHRRNTAIARLLVAAGADPRRTDSRGYDIVAIAAVQNDPLFIAAAVEMGADPRATIGAWGGTALNVAAHLGHAAAVTALLEAGAEPNRRNKAGWTPLIEAIVLGDGKAGVQACVTALIAGGADPSLADRKGQTPLTLARQKGYTEVARVIQQAGGR